MLKIFSHTFGSGHSGPPLLARRVASWWIPLLFALLACSCASGPVGEENNPVDAAGNPLPRLLVFRMSLNGPVDLTSQGYYIVLLNAQGQPIEATDIDTFTDFIRFDGRNFDWFHRQVNLPNPGFTFVQAGNLNQAGRVTPDGRTLEIVLDTGQSTNFINQFIAGKNFTAHALTSDAFGGALIGRTLDTLGQGPNLGSNSLQTLTVAKGVGLISPVPQFYPVDPGADFIVQNDLRPDYPYPSYDITRLEVTAQ